MTELATLACEPFRGARVVAAHGIEAMSTLAHWSVDLVLDDAAVVLDAALGAQAMLSLRDEAGGTRLVPLIVTRASYRGASPDGQRYRLELSASVWLLTQRFGSRIFQHRTTQQIVSEILDDAGLPSDVRAWRLSGRYAERVHCVQYQETEWAFIERLLADEGIGVWCDADDLGSQRLVFGDGPSAHDVISGEPVLRFEDASGMAHTSVSFFAFERAVELAQDAVHVVDFDVRQPDVLIEGRAGAGVLEHYEYPAWVPHQEAAAVRAAVRFEQLRRFSDVAAGKSHSRGSSPAAS